MMPSLKRLELVSTLPSSSNNHSKPPKPQTLNQSLTSSYQTVNLKNHQLFHQNVSLTTSKNSLRELRRLQCGAKASKCEFQSISSAPQHSTLLLLHICSHSLHQGAQPRLSTMQTFATLTQERGL